jgi:hypothetical protein
MLLRRQAPRSTAISCSGLYALRVFDETLAYHDRTVDG